MRMEKVYQGEESPRQEKASDVANSLPSHNWENVDDNDKRGYLFKEEAGKEKRRSEQGSKRREKEQET